MILFLYQTFITEMHDTEECYLIALDMYSQLMFFFCFLFPHSLATCWDCSNLKTPAFLSNQRMYLEHSGLLSTSSRKCQSWLVLRLLANERYTNSHQCKKLTPIDYQKLKKCNSGSRGKQGGIEPLCPVKYRHNKMADECDGLCFLFGLPTPYPKVLDYQNLLFCARHLLSFLLSLHSQLPSGSNVLKICPLCVLYIVFFVVNYVFIWSKGLCGITRNS